MASYHVIKAPRNRSEIRFLTTGKLVQMSAFYKTLQKNTNEDIYILNGGVFEYDTKLPSYTFKSDGKFYREDSLFAGMGVTYEGSLLMGNKDDPVFRDFLSGIPCLLKDGVNADNGCADKNHGGATHRAIVGYNDDYYFLIAIDTNMTFAQEIALCKELGITGAINLDGGGSVILKKNGVNVNTPSEAWERSIHNFIVLRVKQEVPDMATAIGKSPWRVLDANGIQKNAYSVYDNALRYAKTNSTYVIKDATGTQVYPAPETSVADQTAEQKTFLQGLLADLKSIETEIEVRIRQLS